MPITYHVVVPFGRNEEGELMPLDPIEASSSVKARRVAQFEAGKHAGAVAFSRTGNPDLGEFGEAVIVGTFGEVDAEMLGA